MTLTVFLLLTSVLLAAYWFRYACRFILKLKGDDRRAAAALAERNWLSFPTLAEAARDGGCLNPPGLCRALERDYRHLMYLARCPGRKIPAAERWLVAADYRLMSLCFRTCWWLRLPRARGALEEVLGLLLYLSHAVGRKLEPALPPQQSSAPLCPTARSAM